MPGCWTERGSTHQIAADRTVSALYAKRPDNSVLRITARRYVLCCHAIETPRLLLNSTQETASGGGGQRLRQCPALLLTQANQDTQGLTRIRYFPIAARSRPAAGPDARGPFRRGLAAVGTSFMNSGWSGNMDATEVAAEKITAGLKGAALIAALEDEVSRHLRLNSSAETLPDRNNRITLDAGKLGRGRHSAPTNPLRDGRLHVARTGSGAQGQPQVFDLLGATRIFIDVYLSNAIIAGTTRMGRDPKTSVVDADLRTHDHANLYIVGPGTHVTARVDAPSSPSPRWPTGSRTI